MEPLQRRGAAVGALLTPLKKKKKKESLFLAQLGLVFRARNTRGAVVPSAGRAGSPRSQLWNCGSLAALAALRVSRVGRGSVRVGGLR